MRKIGTDSGRGRGNREGRKSPTGYGVGASPHSARVYVYACNDTTDYL